MSLSKVEVGKILFDECRKYLLKSGLRNLNQSTFPKDFPVSRRTLFNFKKGIWSIEVIEKLPIKIELSFCVKIKDK